MKLQLFILCCFLQSIYGSQEFDDPNKIARSICSLQQDGNHKCGGAIINKKWILTTANCVHKSTEVLVGTDCLEGGGTRYAIERSVVHPSFKQNTRGNDIALIEIKDEIEFNDRVDEISYSSRDLPDNVEALHVGWDQSQPKCLKKNTTKVSSTEKCKKSHFGALIDQTHICAYACYGGSGSLLVHKNEVVGIKNFGISRTSGTPEAFIKVSLYYKWIQHYAK